MKNCCPYALAVLLLAAFESRGQDTSIRLINPTVSGNARGAKLAQKDLQRVLY